MIKFSSYNWIFFIVTIILVLIARWLLPFGDEPDFYVRAGEILGFIYGFNEFNPFHVFGSSLHDINVNTQCIVHASPLSLFASIDSFKCMENINQVFMRSLMTLSFISPLVFLCLFKFNIFDRYIYRANKPGYNISYSAIVISFLYPSMLYYVGLFSLEQVTLVFSIFILMIRKNIGLLIIFCVIIFNLDPGNSLVVFLYLIVLLLAEKIYLKYGIKRVIYYNLILVIGALLLGITVLEAFYNIPVIGVKALAMTGQLEDGYFRQKYPLVLRPVITFMTLVFMTAGNVKVVVLYILFGMAIILGLIRYRKFVLSYREDALLERMNLSFVAAITAVGTIFVFVFLFPTYANAKYYIFLLPVFLTFFEKIYGPLKVALFGILSTFIVFLHLAIYMM